MRSSSVLFLGPRALSSAMSIGSISDCFAMSIAFSAVPPTPMPSIPGGHQPAPMVGTVFSTHSAIESEGLSIVNFDFASEPPPLAATIHGYRVAPDELDIDHGRRVVARVLAAAEHV